MYDLPRWFRRTEACARLRARVSRRRRERREAAALRVVLRKPNDRLLADAGIDRETARRSLGEPEPSPRSHWDRWQL